MIENTGRRRIRIIGISLLLLLVLVACVFAWAAANYKGYIKSHIAGQVSKATDGAYSASIQDVDINIFSRRLTVTGLEFWPDSTSNIPEKETGNPIKLTIRLSVPKFQFEGVQIGKLLFAHQLSVNHASIWQGKLTLISTRRLVDSSKIVPSEKKTPSIKKLMAGVIDIIAPNITYNSADGEKNTFTCTLKGGKAVLSNWLMEPGKKDDPTRILFAKSMVVDSAAFMFDKPNLMYITKIPYLYFNSDEHKVAMRDISIHTSVDRDEFYRRLGHRNTIWHTDVAAFQMTGFDWQQLVHKHTLWTSRVDITDPRIDLYFSYLVPTHPTNMIDVDPPRVLHELPLKVYAAEIHSTNAHLKYTELSEKSRTEGVLFFDHIKADGSNATNIDSMIARNSDFTATAEGISFGKSPTKVTLKLSQKDALGNYVITGQMKDVSAAQLREPTAAVALVRLDSLQLHQLDLTVEGNQNYSRSKVTILYDHLKVELLRPKNPPILRTKPLVSAVANTLFIYKENPEPGQAVRTSTAYLERDVMSPFLALIIKNLKVAAKETVVKHKDVVSTLANDKDLQTQKRTFIQRLFGGRKKRK